MRAPVSLDILARVSVAAPCHESWEGMIGDDRVRHCAAFKLHVYNLSDMTADEAAALVQGTEGRLCVRFFRRADGTMITRDCPVGLRAVRAKLARAVGRIAAAFAFLIGGGVTLGLSRTLPVRLRQVQPFAILCDWVSPRKALPVPTQ